jgi:hypothetical protein
MSGLPSCACPDVLCGIGLGLSLFGAYWKGEGDKVVFSGQCFDQHHAPDYCALYLQARANTHMSTENVLGTGHDRHTEDRSRASLNRYLCVEVSVHHVLGHLYPTPLSLCLRACIDVLWCAVCCAVEH